MKFIRCIRGINQPNENNALVLVWLLYFGCGMFEGERERERKLWWAPQKQCLTQIQSEMNNGFGPRTTIIKNEKRL